MKTQEIQLEPNDNLVSIRDHMAWAHTPRVLLIWPLDAGLKLHPTELLLLRRHAESLGQELGLVTRDHDILAAARQCNISVFPRVADAQETQWLEWHSSFLARRFPHRNLRAIRKHLPARDLYPAVTNPLVRVLIFAVGVLAVFVVMLGFIPSAEIQITPPDQNQSVTIAVNSDPIVQDVQLSGLVPQHLLTISVTGKDTALPTGSVVTPDKKATGVVLLTNLTAKAVNIPQASVLFTTDNPPVLFETALAVQVPAGNGKTANVPVKARDAGLSGNVPAGMVTGLQGNSGGLLTVTNTTPITGGTQTSTLIATDQDRESLKKRLLSELQQQALQGLQGQVSSGDVPFLNTVAANRVIDETYTPRPGEAGQKLTLSLTVEFSMAYASVSDLRSLAEQVLNASLAGGNLPGPKQITFAPVSGFTNVGNAIHWQMRDARIVHPFISPGQVIALVQGKSVDKAGKLLTETFGLAESPTISLHPAWWPWLPFLPMRITVAG